MMSFCPLFNNECKGNQCVMWHEEACLIVSFLQDLTQPPIDREIISEEPIVIRGFERHEPVIPDEIKETTPESLADDFMTFLETEFPDSELMPYGGNFQLFLKTKNLTERWNLPVEIQLKIEKAQLLARDGIRKRNEDKKRIRLESEKGELPSLVGRCCDWAISKGFKKVTIADVDAFVLVNEFDLLQETKRSLYVMTNVQLKSKK